MKTGLESLDTGAPKITYSGNEGPKSPQQMQMAMADPLLEDEYEKYVFEMEEQGLEPMSFEEFEREARSGMADGGVMQLVKKNADGSRPGYRGEAAAASDAAGGRDAGRSDTGSASGRGDGPSGGGNGGGDDRRERFMGLQGKTGKVEGVQRNTGLEQNRLSNIMKMDRFTTFKPEVKVPPIGAFSLLKGPLQRFSDFTTEKNRKLFNKVISAGKYQLTGDLAKYGKLDYGDLSEMTDEELEQAYQSLMSDRLSGKTDAFGNPLMRGDDGPMTPLPNIGTRPISPITKDPGPVVPNVPTPFTPAKNFNQYDTDQANKQIMLALGVDPRMFAADGGRIGYAGGGITDLRQGYFLGKLVKKIGKGIKKIAKSPIGKAALLAGGAYMLGGGSFLGKTLPGLAQKTTMGGKNIFNMKNILPNLMKYGVGSVTKGGGTTQGLLGAGGKLSPFRAIGLTSLLPFLMPEEDNLDGSTARADDFNPFDEFGGVAGLRRKVLAGGLDPADFAFMNPKFYAADGGMASARTSALNELYEIDEEDEVKKLSSGGSAGLPPVTMVSEGENIQSFPDDESTGMAQATPTMPNQMPMRPPMMDPRMQQMMMSRMNPMMMGRMNPMMGRMNPMMMGMQQPRIMAQEGGMIDMGGMEKDYRNEGGFVAIGGKERADDVPARLSKNEFVFTADAVRNAGGGDIDKGAEIMENMMENLEAGGKVSKGSQGLQGAREMFATSQRLEEVL
jgi:hypothetical protein